ncbi:hypothetical protein [Flavobacterium sp.]|uniref:hypothetical protein n=1 Tax=Flavobacterium sp. TaxID=239 RepID=UPI0025BBF7EC|nr:hypothetical protein [Flavobacterium sp.]MBA4277142.1 hypothetical protein [Flavobacterium sp.]
MSFKRHDVQEFIEYDLGCLDLNNWKNYKPGLQIFTVDNIKKTRLENCIESDTKSYFYKSIYSFVQALSNINRNNYNWSIVQLYYSCFYAIRADILLSNHCIVRCGGLYMVENKIGEQFQSIIMNARGDHQMAIALLQKLKNEHKLIDEILDVQLEGIDAYSWLMKHRERSNYQMKNFVDPKVDELFQHINYYFKTKTLYDLFDFYNQSDYTICFDLDHSALSIPFKKIMQIKEKIIAKHGLNVSENIKEYQYLKDKLEELGLTKNNVKNFI